MGTVTGGNVIGGSVTGGSVTGGKVTGSVTDGTVTTGITQDGSTPLVARMGKQIYKINFQLYPQQKCLSGFDTYQANSAAHFQRTRGAD